METYALNSSGCSNTVFFDKLIFLSDWSCVDKENVTNHIVIGHIPLYETYMLLTHDKVLSLTIQEKNHNIVLTRNVKVLDKSEEDWGGIGWQLVLDG